MICRYYLTYQCQCRCEYCKIWQKSEFHDIPLSSAKEIEQNLISMKKMGVRRIVFTGGEPLLRHDLPQILKCAKQNKFHVSLFTNGMLYPAFSKDLRGLIDQLFVSIDAPNEDEHDRIRGQECFREAIESLDIANSLGIKPIINFTLTRNSIQYLPDMAEMALEHTAKLRLNPVHHFEGLEGFEEISIEYILRYAFFKSVDINRAGMELMRLGGNNVKKPVCRALNTTITISPDDHLILPCLNINQSRIPINGRLESIIKSDIVKGYKKAQGKMDMCRGCTDMNYLAPSFKNNINKYWLLDILSKCENSLKQMGKNG